VKKLSIVIPVYNERGTIEEILSRVRAADLPGGLERQIVIVDDASDDGTAEVLESIREAANDDLELLRHSENRGKGAALRTGFGSADGDILLVQDADLEYHPRDYPSLLAPILDGEADVVYGSRFHGGPQRVLLFWHYLGNRALTFLSNLLSDLNLSDMETCYKVMRREALDGMELKSNRFGIEPELTAKLAKRKLRIFEVPISYYGRTYAEGKKIGWRDGIAAVWAILRYNLLP
jgi:glycosyltransferase involved in cell wall biosynthesis